MQICETERLILRRLSLEDVPALTEILSDPEVMKHSVRGVCDETATRKFIEWCLACYESHGVGPWALIDKKALELIGFCGVGPEMVADVEEINLGYRLARRYWNKGLASEAARAVLHDTQWTGTTKPNLIPKDPEVSPPVFAFSGGCIPGSCQSVWVKMNNLVR